MERANRVGAIFSVQANHAGVIVWERAVSSRDVDVIDGNAVPLLQKRAILRETYDERKSKSNSGNTSQARIRVRTALPIRRKPIQRVFHRQHQQPEHRSGDLLLWKQF